MTSFKLLSAVLTICPYLFLDVVATPHGSVGPWHETDWTKLRANNDIQWTRCYTGMKCARFNVPLNYSDPKAGHATLAMIQIPAKVSKHSKQYGGPVFFNPGGPGVSGVEFLTSSGAALSQILGPTFDIVSFDPRGIGRSTPQASFFKNHIERSFWDFGADTLDMNSTIDAIPRHMARYQVLGQLAKDRDTGILQHMTTDNVARDMLTMTKALGTEKLKYWGISYGTALGATFAAMFPDKVDRLIIDGVLDAEAYYSNDWSSQLEDTDKAFQIFFDGCFAAGPTDCPFHAGAGSSDEIKQNYNNLLASVLAQPVPAYSNTSELYGIVDYATVRTAVFESLYSPYSLYQPLAGALAALAAGDGSFIYQLTAQLTSPATPLSEECNATHKVDFENVYESEMAVACGDGAPVSGDVPEMKQFADKLKSASVFSDFLVANRVKCSGWKIHPPHFMGPISGNTSFPLLIIGNTADPVTPLATAKLTSTRFPKSVVLTQDSPGHASFAAPSVCTAGHVRAYFVNGTLPAAGTVCPVDAPLFPPASEGAAPSKREIDVLHEELRRFLYNRRTRSLLF